MKTDSAKHCCTVLAVDIGTSGCRAGIYGQDGSELATAERSYGVTYSDNGFAEQDPEQIYGLFIEVLQQCVTESRVSVDYVVIGSVLHSLILLDGAGKPLTPLSIWADTRAVGQCQRMSDLFESGKWHERTGCPLSPTYPLYRLLWYKENDPELYNTFHKAVSIKSYIHFRLFGLYLEDHSVASGSGLFNIQTRVWDRVILDLLGLDEDKLPEAVPVEYQIPNMNLSKIQSLSGNTIWIMGGADGPLAHVGTAGWNENVASLTIGTSGAVRMMVDTPHVSQNSPLWCYVLNKKSYISGLATNNGGNVVDWYVNAFYPAGTDWRELEGLLVSTKPDPDLLFNPHMFRERDFRSHNSNSAQFTGLKNWHTRDDLLRAVVEGVVFNVVALFDLLRFNCSEIEAVVVSGGLANSDYVRRIISSAIALPVINSFVENASLSGLTKIVFGEMQGGCNNVNCGNEHLNVKKYGQYDGDTDEGISEKYCNWKNNFIIMNSKINSNFNYSSNAQV